MAKTAQEGSLKAFIFDFDDTLEDWAGAKRIIGLKLSKKMFERYGIYGPTTFSVLADVDREFSVAGVGKNPKHFDREPWAKEFFRRVGVKATKKECIDFAMFYWRFAIEGAKPLPYARSVLKRLSKDYKLAILSDSDGKKTYKVERIKSVGLYEFFNKIVTSDDVNQNKPSRKMYDLVLKSLKVKPSECVMVGDKPEVDLELAKKLGMTTVWVKHGGWASRLGDTKFKYVDYEITDLRRLIKIAGKVSAEKLKR